jgi:glucose/arabinose dehydrogenase
MLRLAALITFITLPCWAAAPQPGDRFRVDPAALAKPNATPSSANPADIVARPKGATPTVPPGWRASLFAEGLDHPRNLIALPDGNVLVAEQRADKLTLLRDDDGDGRAEATTFATGFAEPFGLDYRDGMIWVADTRAVWRLAWRPGQAKAGTPERLTPPGALGDDRGHSTRSLALAPDGDSFVVGIGSRGNIGIETAPRATIQRFDASGGNQRNFATGLRNPVGMAFRPGTDELWAVVNERDGLGDELVPDYLTRVTEDGFYGWPYSYIGSHPQPGLAERAPDLVRRAIVPDLLFRSHSAPLGLTFQGGDAYVALHGSWNRSEPIDYVVARVPFQNGRPFGHYEVFASGFMVSEHAVWGRPAGIAAAPDGALYVADDVGRTVWRIERIIAPAPRSSTAPD